MNHRRLVIIGLDCAAPELVFSRWRGELPHLSRLMREGAFGALRSTDPPITIPAWTAMMTSRDPGQLGLYGFRNRRSYAYGDLGIATAQDVPAPRLWDILSNAGRTNLVLGVPQTYPPQPLKGLLVSCFLTPSKQSRWTYPRAAAPIVDEAAGGEYLIDAVRFRSEEKARLADEITDMTRRRFRAFRELWHDRCDFGMLVEMGVDRAHHAFWRTIDPSHRLHDPEDPFAGFLRSYYQLIDDEIGATLARLGDDIGVLVVSDHGAKSMRGAVAVNELLIREGLLVLKRAPDGPTPLTPQMVDWSRTLAWAEGGYYARVFFNIAGREPQGSLRGDEVEGVARRLRALFTALTDEVGVPLGSTVHSPAELYREVRGIAPDLIVYLGDLEWRAVATVGGGAVHVFENDTGPDDANHDRDGIFIASLPGLRLRPREQFSIYDVAPTALDWLGVKVPEEMIGRSLLEDSREKL